MQLIVYDNSPQPLPAGTVEALEHYHHDPLNGGLVSAYNFALGFCEERSIEWLLLLDQDSSIPQDYLLQFNKCLSSATSDCVAFVPKVRIKGRISSPKRFIFSRPRLNVAASSSGPVREEIVAINSGMFVRVGHLRQRGGYPKHYRLDAVDFWFCADAYASGKHLFILDVVVEHTLSIRDMASVSLERWESIASSDADFTIEMRSSRATRLIAAMEGLTYSAFLLAKGYPRHARTRLKHAARVAKSLWRRG
ncbi:MAG: hypothetical protein SF187_19160 [Deltaproteobacteria bacterium]|nr:hypothetical protein [Deltaproteobacteria bacterium]